MNWLTLKRHLILKYHPALVAEHVISFASRRRLLTGIGWLTVLFGLATLGLAPSLRIVDASVVSLLDTRLLGLFFLFFAAWIFLACFRALHYYYADEQFELARVFYYSSVADPVKSFVTSPIGRLILARLGVTVADITSHLKNRQAIIPAGEFFSEFSFSEKADTIGLADYFGELLRVDEYFGHFISSFGVTKEQAIAVARSVVESETGAFDTERWWRREHLGRIRGIGKTWNYGRLYELEKFQYRLASPSRSFYGDKELAALEAILRRGQPANAFLVGDNLEEKMEIVAQLNELIEEETVMPELKHKQLFVLDTDLLISAAETMSDFERLIRTLASEAAGIGNIILVFLDFPAFIVAGQHYGLDVAAILDPFFTAPELQIIALAADRAYHSILERNPALAERFGEVTLAAVGSVGTLRAVQTEALIIESRQPVFFTYQSLQTLVEGGDRYIVAGLQPEKSLNLLRELVPSLTALSGRGNKNKMATIVHRQDVEDFLRTKTGIPMGRVNEGERAQLLNLEKILHQRIIGQNEAVNAVSAAVRRARSGINSPERPLGSFLFLGPTGVGKTETTKALADVFFGHGATGKGELAGEAIIERLDMSEYSAADALEKLIGESAGAPGILADMVREHPYGVLLLDEFEKTTPDVMNLFLQILDEGFFSDGQGVKVNCRNLLIIATSNAGAEMIWDAVKRGDDLRHARELILDALIHSGIFRPELLNRFDGVIIFHPLAQEQLKKIARLQLEKLAKRLAERSINLAITDELVRFVTKAGLDPKFGARPMTRAIQDTVEQAVADKIIIGNLLPGTTITLNSQDLIAAHH